MATAATVALKALLGGAYAAKAVLKALLGFLLYAAMAALKALLGWPSLITEIGISG